MACGVPLVSTKVGVMPDLLPEEYLCEPGDESALADLLAICGDEDRLATLCRICGERMTDLGVDDFCAQTLALYRSLTAGALER